MYETVDIRMMMDKAISSIFERRCCINQPQARLPQPQAWLRHSRRLRTAQLCEPIEDGSPNVQFVDLSLERA